SNLKTTIFLSHFMGSLYILMISLASCTKKTCEVCHDKKRCKEYTVTIDGVSENGDICKECIKDFTEKIEKQGGTVEKN
ncbi:MAG: hypothetical protein Q4E53_06975, partial [Eubacteriales bacterium]|nr:hypothetical protein [Eubacteriales bacterium]